MLKRGLTCEIDDQVTITGSGADFFLTYRLGIHPLPKSNPPVSRICLDWSGCRSHLVCRLGQWILSDIFEMAGPLKIWNHE
jgi:hypothetical protein